MSEIVRRNHEDTKQTKVHEERFVQEGSSCSSFIFVAFVVPALAR